MRGTCCFATSSGVLVDVMVPNVRPPPWIQTSTGIPPALGSGVQTLRLRQSSPIGGRRSIAAAVVVVPLTFVAPTVALWRRSLGWGLVVFNGAVAFKTGWTFVVDGGGAGALAHLPAAVVGLAVVDLALIW